MKRTIVFWSLYWGPLIFGHYHIYHMMWVMKGRAPPEKDLVGIPLRSSRGRVL